MFSKTNTILYYNKNLNPLKFSEVHSASKKNTAQNRERERESNKLLEISYVKTLIIFMYCIVLNQVVLLKCLRIDLKESDNNGC